MHQEEITVIIENIWNDYFNVLNYCNKYFLNEHEVFQPQYRVMKKISPSVLSLLFLIFAISSIAQVADKAEDISPLLVGEKIPADSILDANGAMINTADILAKKPTLLVIFRGGWCPHCNVQLAGLAVAEEEIQKLGYQIVAISPDDYKKIAHIETKNNVKYQLYADKDARLITKMGLAFNTGGKRGTLPVPTVMVLNQNGEILFEHINPNYKERIEAEYLLAVLKALQSKS